jgi:predicted transcriptional regulator
MSYQLKKLLPRHFKVMDLLLLGKKQKEIAEELDLTPQAVSSIVNSPIFQERLASRKHEVLNRSEPNELSAKQLLEKTVIEAVKKLAEMLGSKDDRTALKAAIDILDRTGHSGPKGVYRSKTVVFSSEETIEKIRISLGGLN